jgi:hypothetical protein
MLFGVIIFVVLNVYILPVFFSFGLASLVPYAVINAALVLVVSMLLSRKTEDDQL